ncbi:hypothetical protein ACHAW6_001185 [Cyclotella cf. meneghiniana]
MEELDSSNMESRGQTEEKVCYSIENSTPWGCLGGSCKTRNVGGSKWNILHRGRVDSTAKGNISGEDTQANGSSRAKSAVTDNMVLSIISACVRGSIVK